jgi:GNAT superfamily N-acetyltransferase
MLQRHVATRSACAGVTLKFMQRSEGYVIRRVEARDAGIVALHRALMFQEMELVAPHEFEPMRKASEDWLAGLLAAGQYAGWLVEFENTVAAGGGILIREMGPVPGCYRSSRWAHIVNVYTAAEHRRRGLARMLMGIILDWCAANGFRHVTLTASAAGRPLYESLGFIRTWDMRLARPLDARKDADL